MIEYRGLDNSAFMAEEEYRRLREMVAGYSGLVLRGDKRLTLHMKLSHRLDLLGLATYADYLRYIENDSSGREMVHLVSHITNSETFFFREKPQLDFFAELLKEIKKEKQKKEQRTLEILSVGCSSGEEPYSLSILVMESGLFVWDWDVRVTGMDINETLLEKAENATYSRNSFRTEAGSNGLLKKYFSVDNHKHLLKKAFVKNVRFVQGNLVEEESYRRFSELDVIFCRNVLIYMNDAAFDRILGNFYHALSNSGYLFIGSSESLIQRTNLFVPEYRNGVIVYRKNVRD